MDAVAAFLAADLKEKIFMKMPTELQQYFGKYVQILKSLYGLKQAARMWYLLVSDYLKEIGFSPMAVDPTIFRHTKSGVIIGVHVDDFMITGADEVAIGKVKEKLKGRFEMKDLGEAENILGIRIQRYKGMLIIDQSQFAKEIVAQFLYDDSMKHATPMEPEAIRNLVQEPGRTLNHDEWFQYVELLGKLIWLCNTRFDIIFAVNRMASFTVEACWNHWKALMRILGYVSRTIHYGIRYGGNNEHAEGVEGGNIDYYSIDHNTFLNDYQNIKACQGQQFQAQNILIHHNFSDSHHRMFMEINTGNGCGNATYNAGIANFQVYDNYDLNAGGPQPAAS